MIPDATVPEHPFGVKHCRIYSAGMAIERDSNWWARKHYGICLLMAVGIVTVPALIYAVVALLSD